MVLIASRCPWNVPSAFVKTGADVTIRRDGAIDLLSSSVRRAVCGFAAHDRYVEAARAASARLSPSLIEQRLRLNIAMDANPVSGLFDSIVDVREFMRRWNDFNSAASLGVKTHLRTTTEGTEVVNRISRTAESDDPFRSSVISACIGMLNISLARHAEAAVSVNDFRFERRTTYRYVAPLFLRATSPLVLRPSSSCVHSQYA